MPSLTIGDRTARLPIIQGGMAVRISMEPLATAVAKAGGIGIIAGSGMETDELAGQVRRTREATSGVFGVNVMVAVRKFAELVKVSMQEGADVVIAGAGFSRDIFGWGKEYGVPVVPIVGSVRVAKLAEKFGAAAVVVEGVEAGGHLGTDRFMLDLLPEIVEAVDIPVIGAGGVVTGADIKRTLDAGAAGVQMGSRFAATVESSASDEFKQMYMDATDDDIILVKSPVGLPGRAIRSPFTARIATGEEVDKGRPCRSCLKECHKEYCIVNRLERAQEGDVTEGLVFAGQSAARLHDIPHVADLMRRLETEWRAAEEGVSA